MSPGFTIRGEIRVLGTIAINRSIRELALLKRLQGPGRWRKLKGEAIVELPEREAWPWATARSSRLNCIGMKRTESAAAE
jgi:hypothetical protein